MKKELEELKRVIERVSGIDDISKKNRSDDYKIARAVLFDYAVNYLECTLSLSGSIVNRDHASVHNALKKTATTYRKDYPMFNVLRKKVEKYYRTILLKNIGEDSTDIDSMEDMFKIQMMESDLKIIELTKKIQLLQDKIYTQREKAGKFKYFLDIPEDKQNDFIETRLKPYLRMNAI